jgi:hypothetical protein
MCCWCRPISLFPMIRHVVNIAYVTMTANVWHYVYSSVDFEYIVMLNRAIHVSWTELRREKLYQEYMTGE